MSQKFKSEVALEALNNATTDTDRFLVSDSSVIKYRTGAQLLSDLGVSGLFVPYTGATGNVDLGTHTLLAKDLIINHSSGSGVAASITKNGSGEALTVIKGSGSGNAMSVTGGLTSLVNLSLSTVANATGDFLTHSGSTINKRTPAQVLSDIGGQAALTNPITGTGTTNYVSKFTGTNSLGNSLIYDSGSGVSIGDTPTLSSGPWYGALSLGKSGTDKAVVGYLASMTNGAIVGGHNSALNAWANLNIVGGDVIFRGGEVERMRMLEGGNVGIGTSSPNSLLQVGASNFVIADRTSAVYGPESQTIFTVGRSGVDYPQLLNFGVNQAGLYSSISARQFTVATENNLVLQPNGGNVGIGTTSPSSRLHVYSSGEISKIESSTTTLYQTFRANGTDIGYIGNGTGVASGGSATDFGVQAPNNFVFATGGSSERMRITTGGNVGIGTSSPSQKLTVAGGQTLLDQLQYTRALNVGGSDLNNLIVAGFYDGSALTNAPDSVGWYYITVERHSNAGSTDWIHQTATSFGAGNDANIIYSRTKTGGTWTPWKTLTTSSDISGTTNYVSKFTGANSLGNSLIYDNGTNVGIGTTSPTFVTTGTTVLDVNGSTGATIYLRANIAQGSYLRQTSNNLVIGNNTYGDVTFSTGFAEAMRVTADRLVGIGTSAPSEKLDVYGVVRGLFSGNPGTGGITGKFLTFSPSPYGLTFRGYGTGTHSIQVQRESNDAEVFSLSLNPNGGNVGIGTTSPSTKLDVNGISYFNSDLHTIQGGGIFFNGLQNYSSGIYSRNLGADLVLQAGSSERMRITSSGNVGIGTSSPNASAVLHLRSTTQGFLPPVMRTGDRDNIGSPAAGLMIFNEDDEVIQVYTNGSGWRTLAFL